MNQDAFMNMLFFHIFLLSCYRNSKSILSDRDGFIFIGYIETHWTHQSQIKTPN
jgi:hypothetical protein